MSKTVSVALLGHLRGGLTSLATCWLIECKDGTNLGFTDNEVPLVIKGIVYSTLSGYKPSAVDASLGLSVDNLEVDGLLNSAAINARDIHAGKYDYARVTVFYANKRDPSQGAMVLRKGFIGNITFQKGTFKAEVRGLMQALTQKMGEVITRHCRATLGDARCKVDLTPYTSEHQVLSVANGGMITFTDNIPVNAVTTTSDTAAIAQAQEQMTLLQNKAQNPANNPIDTANYNYQVSQLQATITSLSNIQVPDYFAYGTATPLTGECAGVSIEIKASGSNYVQLMLPAPYNIAPGDRIRLVAGCSREKAVCQTRYNNYVNYRGFYDVPDPTVVQLPGGVY